MPRVEEKPAPPEKSSIPPPPVELQTAAGRVIFIRTPRRLSPEQVVLALTSMDDEDPRWLAFNQILDEELATRTLDSTNPDAPDHRMRHASGGIEALATLKQRLSDERKKTVDTKPARR